MIYHAYVQIGRKTKYTHLILTIVSNQDLQNLLLKMTEVNQNYITKLFEIAFGIYARPEELNNLDKDVKRPSYTWDDLIEQLEEQSANALIYENIRDTMNNVTNTIKRNIGDMIEIDGQSYKVIQSQNKVDYELQWIQR